jgi:putative flippase GtrA
VPGLIKLSLIDKLLHRPTFMQYAVIGVSGIIIYALIFTVLVYGLQVKPAVATTISTSCGIINNFVWNARITFKKRDHILKRFALFFGVGSAGIAASALVLVLFTDIFVFNALLVKLVSLPPILLGQYFLNKRVSFGDRLPSLRKFGAFLKTRRLLISVYVIFAIVSGLAVKFTPYITNSVGAPDEWQHYGKNVEFLLDNHRLAVSGQDDQDSLSTCRNNDHGQAVCLYSYQFTAPHVNDIVSAMTAKIGSAFGLSELTGARLASTLWGLVYITGAYLIARLFIGYRWAVGLTAIVAFIPQVIFISSYVSDDIHSLALSMLFVYTSLAYIMFGRKQMRWWFFAAFGSLFLGKYNYIVLALVPLLLLAQRWVRSRDHRQLLTDLGWMAGAALLIGGPWFVRNLILYHDLTGLNFTLHEMSKHHPLGDKISFTDPHSYLLLFRFDSLNTLFGSFFAWFGYMHIRLDESYYTLLKAAVITGAAALAIFGNRKVRLALAGAGLLVAIMFGLVLVNAFTYDYQFQGRYMFSTIAVIVAVIAFALSQWAKSKQHHLARGWLFGGVCVMAVVLLQSVLVVGTNLVNFYR